MPEIKVIFRVFPEGDVLALFPEEPGDSFGNYCSCYQHHGQHGQADYTGCIRGTRPAGVSEYDDLARELRQIGYRLSVCRRSSRLRHSRLMAKLQ